MITRSVNLEEKHIEYIDSKSINLSDWVRKRLDEEIEAR